jgi:acetate kinase
MNEIDFLISKVELLKDFSKERLAEMLSGSSKRSFDTNEGIAFHGNKASHLFIILDGKVSASILYENSERRNLGILNAGDTFGELALMTGEPVLADYIAESHCEILQVPLTFFHSIIMSEPKAVQHISKKLAERVKELFIDTEKGRALLRPSDDPYGLNLKGERPEKILVINCGSSSLKYSFYDTENDSLNAHGQVERIGISGTRMVHQSPKGEIKRDLQSIGFKEAFSVMAEILVDKECGIIKNTSEVSVIAHRVVHGGERFTQATLISEKVLNELEVLNPLAPLHNPVNLAGIREMQKLFPSVPHIAVFDTAFHHTLPAYAYLYGLPYEMYEEKRIRRYGFHGTSHKSVSLRAAQFLGSRPNELRIVSCHLGNGSSVCAIDHGRSVDTSMGFTPAEGLIMGTRCGDIDIGVASYLERSKGMTASELDELFNKKSGLLGLSGISSDMRELLKAADEGQYRALLAIKTYCYRVRKYLGAYVASMGGVDAVIFTGGIGQGSSEVRTLALQSLDCLGIVIDENLNKAAKGFDEISKISSDKSKITVLIVPTDEERMMAREALSAINRTYLSQVMEERDKQPFPVEVSAHHAHLCQEHVEMLYGKGHILTHHAALSQPGQFACKEQLNIIGPKGKVERVRVLGPARKFTQIEIAMTEQFKLGLDPPIRESGDLTDTPGCILEGPAGSVKLDKGVICALRHIHMTPEDALRYGVRDKSFVRVRVEGDREMVFGDVLVRVDKSYALAMHIDTDEANAANLKTGALGYIEEIQNKY